MKRLFYFFLFVCVAVIANAQAKYVFYSLVMEWVSIK